MIFVFQLLMSCILYISLTVVAKKKIEIR